MRKTKKRAALAARPITKSSLIDATTNSEKRPSPQASIWTSTEREKMIDVSIAIASPPLVPTDDPNERLPMRIARRERPLCMLTAQQAVS